MIRKYTREDKTAVVDLLKINTPEYFDLSEEKDLIAYLENELEDYFVVEIESVIVGAGGINYFPEERIARISWDMIHPDFQGRGVGKTLIQYRIDHIKAKSFYNTIEVRTSQLVAKFYHKMGFEIVSIKKDYWAKGYDLYQMIYKRNTGC